MEQVMFIIYYITKKFIVSVFDCLWQRRPVVELGSRHACPASGGLPFGFYYRQWWSPHQADEAYVNFAMTTTLNIIIWNDLDVTISRLE